MNRISPPANISVQDWGAGFKKRSSVLSSVTILLEIQWRFWHHNDEVHIDHLSTDKSGCHQVYDLHNAENLVIRFRNHANASSNTSR